MRKLYVCSKPFGGRRRLIGELTEENGEYTFAYRLGGKLHEWFLLIDEFPDINRVYKGDEVRAFVERIVPRRDFWCIDGFLKAANLENYDEWGLLKYCGQFNAHEDAFLFEEKPEGVIVYED